MVLSIRLVDIVGTWLRGATFHYHTFPISNLTPNRSSIFADISFPNEDSHRFSFLFYFPLKIFKKKTKISGTLSFFQKINFFTK